MSETAPKSRNTVGDYDVGFGKPPQHMRLKKGQSGNPRGRPRGSLSFSSLLEKVLAEKVAIVEKGRRRKMPNREVMVRQAIKQAILGDLRFFRLIFEAAKTIEEPPANQNPDGAMKWFRSIDLKNLTEEEIDLIIHALDVKLDGQPEIPTVP